MKKTIALLLIVLAAIILSGCLNKEAYKFEKVSLKKNVSKSEPVLLEKIIDENNVALQLAIEKRDFLSGDKYLEYVNNAKERDEEDRQKITISELAAAVNQAQESVANQTQPEPTAPTEVTTNPTPEPAAPQTEPDTQTEPTDPQTNQGYSIVFPQGWEVKDSSVGDVIVASAWNPPEGEGDIYSENMSVVPEDLPMKMSSEAYLAANMFVMTQVLTEYQEYERGDATIGGKSAKRVVFSYKMGEFKIKAIMYFVVNDIRGYVISGVAIYDQFDNYLTQFEDSIKTFKFK